MKKGVSVYVSQQMMQILSFMNYLALMIKINAMILERFMFQKNNIIRWSPYFI